MSAPGPHGERRAGHRTLEELAAELPVSLRAQPVASLPQLSIRAQRALKLCGIERLGDFYPHVEEDLLSLSNFGIASLKAIRAALALAAAPFSGEAQPAASGEELISHLAAALPAGVRQFEVERIPGLAARARTRLPSIDVHRIEDLIGLEDAALLALPNLGTLAVQSIADGLEELLDQARAEPKLMEGSREEVIERLVARTPCLQEIDACVAAMGEVSRAICAQRLLPEGEANTLEEVAAPFGLTRERIRQLELAARKALDPHGDLKSVASARLTRLRQGRTGPLFLSELERLDPWFVGTADRPAFFSAILGALGCEHAVAHAEEDRPFLSARGAVPLSTLVEAFKGVADGRVLPDRLDEVLGSFLKDRSAPELFALVRSRLPGFVACERGVVFEPHLVDQVEAVLLAAKGPLSISKIEARLSRAGVEYPASGVRGVTGRLDLVRTGPSEYVLPSRLAQWDEYSERLFEASEPLMQANLEHQWSTAELLSELQEAGHAWAAELPLHAAEYVLGGEASPCRRLGRGMWGLPVAKATKRLNLVEVGAKVLEEAGTPLLRHELEQRVRQVRSFGNNLVVQWPLALLRDGRVGLGVRDLGIDQTVFDAVWAGVAEKLADCGRVSAADLRALVETHGPSVPPLEAHLLARVFRVNTKVQIDGDGQGDGLRCHDVPREGTRAVAPRRGPRRPRGRPRGRPALSSPRTPVREAPVSAPTAVRSSPTPPNRLTTDEIQARMRANFGKELPFATLSLRLRLAGWYYDPKGDTWTKDADS